MLEKNKKNYADGLFFTKNEAINSVEAETDNSCIFYDAHFHLYHCIDAGDKADGKNNDAEYIRSYIKKIHGISCSQTFSEWEQNRNFIQSVESSNFTTDKGISDGTNLFTNTNIINAAGLHPYDISAEKTDECDAFIQRLFTECEKENIHAIGETGFDFFTNELKLQEDLQDKYFLLQLEPAQKYNLPLFFRKQHRSFESGKKNPLLLFQFWRPAFSGEQKNAGMPYDTSFRKNLTGNRCPVSAAEKPYLFYPTGHHNNI